MGIVPNCFSNIFASKHKISSSKQPSTQIEELCHHFSLEELRKSTNNFNKSRSIDGVFGRIYKGFINIGGTDKIVAIKPQSKRFKEGLREFKNEIQLLCQLRHPNLISLIGFCISKKEIIMVHEFMPNGSFHDHLHGNSNCNDMPLPPLSWKKRLEICIGVARGLHYLHTGAKRTIFHRDVKTSSILLDEYLVPKLGDFAISLKGPVFSSKGEEAMEVDSTMSTQIYAAPEYVMQGKLTDKADVYSFGVVLVEVVCKKTPEIILSMILEEMKMDSKCKYADKDDDGDQCGYCPFYMNLATKVGEFVKNGNADKIIDPFLKGKIASKCWSLFLDIAERCLIEERRERPTIGEVEVELERALQLQEEAEANDHYVSFHY